MENSDFKTGKVICVIIEGHIEEIKIEGEKDGIRTFTSFPIKKRGCS